MTLLNIGFIIIGVALVIWGADRLTEGASSLARGMRVPEIVIGLTIVAAGTSAPELFVSLTHHRGCRYICTRVVRQSGVGLERYIRSGRR